MSANINNRKVGRFVYVHKINNDGVCGEIWDYIPHPSALPESQQRQVRQHINKLAGNTRKQSSDALSVARKRLMLREIAYACVYKGLEWNQCLDPDSDDDTEV